MSRSRVFRSITFGAILGVLFLGAIILGSEAQARDLPTIQRELQETNDARVQLRADLLEAQEQQQNALAEMIMLELELAEMDMAFVAASESLQYFEELLAETEARLAEAETAKEERLDVLRARIRFLHQNGNLSYIELLLTSQSLTDFVNNREHFRRILEHDQEIIEALQSLETEIAQARDNIDAQRIAVQIHTDELALAMAEHEAIMAHRAIRMAELLENEEYAQQLYDANVAVGNQLRQEQAAAQSEANRIAAQARLAQLNTNFSSNANALMHWPVSRAPHVNSGYGWRQRPIGSGTEFHTGLDMPAPAGTRILAADCGVVTAVRTGWNGGFGNMIIIQHANGISTKYTHIQNGSIRVSLWEQVERGQHIAGVGSTGHSTGNHLHFEVHRNGQHVDPGPFLQ